MKKKLFIATILVALVLTGTHAQEALPLGWHSTDIGAQDIPGSTTWDPDAELFTLESTGDQVFGSDNVHFAYTVQTLLIAGVFMGLFHCLASLGTTGPLPDGVLR